MGSRDDRSMLGKCLATRAVVTKASAGMVAMRRPFWSSWKGQVGLGWGNSDTL
jgi:hypothetical protein